MQNEVESIHYSAAEVKSCLSFHMTPQEYTSRFLEGHVTRFKIPMSSLSFSFFLKIFILLISKDKKLFSTHYPWTNFQDIRLSLFVSRTTLSSLAIILSTYFKIFYPKETTITNSTEYVQLTLKVKHLLLTHTISFYKQKNFAIILNHPDKLLKIVAALQTCRVDP